MLLAIVENFSGLLGILLVAIQHTVNGYVHGHVLSAPQHLCQVDCMKMSCDKCQWLSLAYMEGIQYNALSMNNTAYALPTYGLLVASCSQQHRPLGSPV